MQIKHDSYRARDAYVLERTYPDGLPDTSFAQQGSTLFTLGPDNEGPAALRLDAQDRPWVAGASTRSGEATQAVVLRYVPHGAPDASWGDAGRSVSSPGARSARALDLLPQADGGALVVGTVVDASGQERTGWWRLRADGKLDPRFGLGGLWADAGSGSTAVLDLAMGGDGSVALTLQRSEGASNQLEAWLLLPGRPNPVLTYRAVFDPDRRLVWLNGEWRWAGGALPPAAPAVRASSVASAAHGQPAPQETAAAGPGAASAPLRPSPAPASEPASNAAAACGWFDLSIWLPLLLIFGPILGATVAWLHRRGRKTQRQ